MRRAFALGVIAVVLAAPGSARAAGTPCGSVIKAGWKASDIRATHLTCASAGSKLRRWLPPPLPSNPIGWNCFPFRGRRMCAVGQGDAPRFTFKLSRRAGAAQVERRCRPVSAGVWRASKLSAFNMGCPSARSKLRGWLRHGRLPNAGTAGWDCTKLRAGPGQCVAWPSDVPIGFKYRLRRARVPFDDRG